MDLGGLNVRRAFCILRDRQGIKWSENWSSVFQQGFLCIYTCMGTVLEDSTCLSTGVNNAVVKAEFS